MNRREIIVAKRRNGKKHVPLGFSKHHRRPRSLGGDSSDRNISVVQNFKHKAWTELFDNFPPSKIAELFGKYWREFSNNSKILLEARRAALASLQESKLLDEYASVYSEEELKEVKVMLENHTLKTRKLRAWRILFGGKHLEEVVGEINRVWLDPDYRLVVDAYVEKIAVRRSL